MLAEVEDGRLLGVCGNAANPYTGAQLCRKVAHYEDRVYHADRVLTPLLRSGPKGSGNFSPISWDDAIELITARWKSIIAESGPEAILPYSYAGTMGVVSMTACDNRLWPRMGASRLLRTICSSTAGAGYAYVNGSTAGMDPEDFARSQFIIIWGANVSSTNVHLMPFLRKAQAAGATLVVIDPYRTRTANAADWYLQPRPGTDGALALGIAHVLFRDGLADEPYLEQKSVGWREYRERCLAFTPDAVSAITGLPANEIERLARAYGESPAPAIRLGYGLSRTTNGGSMIRAITTLPALVGAWGKPGSGLLLSSSGHFPLNRAHLAPPHLRRAPAEVGGPDYGRPVSRAINMNVIGRALLEEKGPPIRALYVYNSNPAAVAPDSNRVRQGLTREDLFTVVHEQMMTDTALLADLVLPATTQMECLDLMTAYGHLYLNLCKPVIAPLGESRSNLEVLNAIALAMGFDEPCFHESAEDVIRGALESSHPWLEGVTYEYLEEHGFAKLQTEKLDQAPFARSAPFRTESGRIELLSAAAERDGLDPLPGYTPPMDGSEENEARYPINLLSPAAHHFLNSSFANQKELQKGEKSPRIWIHREDAEARSIVEGDLLRVWNDRGEVMLTAAISDRAQPGCAWSPSLWWARDSPDGRNVNALTSDCLADMGGGSTFHTNRIEIERAPAP